MEESGCGILIGYCEGLCLVEGICRMGFSIERSCGLRPESVGARV